MSLSLAATMSLVEELRHRGEDFCLVTVIRTANATSAKAGAKAVVTGDGALHGFVGGGCVQGALTRTALAALQAGAPRLIRVRPKEARFAEADRRLEGFDLAAVALRAQDAVVVATQGRRDREALQAALLSPAGYVGMVGSRAKIAKLLGQLAEDVPEPRRRRLHGPAGLDIGAIDPEEIALSILGEIVQERRRAQRSRQPEPLRAP